ncbi:hypothetical protein TorRG33x02_036030 [Trema orientale]|uniref:RNase H type-1 domain-containing protein n=1 Tax=Trema orientale TaxID=63057 RepID=A0A2P5FRZ2_TREOI|nr:hypothetical protein TorRG33x02_036030 [Trema orientale]
MIIWHSGATGRYRVRSGHKAIVNSRNRAESSNPLPKPADFEIWCVVCWMIRHSRNRMIHGEDAETPLDRPPGRCGGTRIFEYKKLQNCSDSLLQKRLSIATRNWKPPPLGCLKLKVDAAVPKNGDSVGIGVVIRDHLGDVKAGNVLENSRYFLGVIGGMHG